MTDRNQAASIVFVVDDDSTAIALGSGDVPVLGTPKVVALCEEAAVRALAGTLEPSETTVGMDISIDHSAPTAIGESVIAEAKLVSADGRLRRFDVSVSQGGATVASGTHTRVVVDRDRFLNRLARP